MKIRVHEMAKQYKKANKEFLELINNLGIEVKSHLSGLTDEQITIIKEHLEKESDTENTKEGRKKKKKKVKSKKKEKKEKEPKEKKEKKKKGKRNEFTMNKNEELEDEVIEEDGVKLIKIRGEITLGNFAEKLGINVSELIKKLFLKGQMLTINSVIDMELAEELAEDYDAMVEQEEIEEMAFGDKFNLEMEDKETDLLERAPIITIMGHVDHGKTSLLDAIREANVADGEAGGITQKIGAYQVRKDGKLISFVDTPGHEAFTEMRARGAQVTDIAILVVAADDGVMPQTIEAIAHAKSANVPIIIAVNKIDKEGADPSRVKNELMEHGLVPVEWGGDVEFIEISAKFRKNLEGILDTILITAEMLELKGNPKKRAKGVVMESRLDPKVGPIADILVQEGTLRVGDIIVAGESYGKVRALINDKAQKVQSVSLSQPAEVIGFNSVPEAGGVMYVVQNEQHARRIVEEVEKDRKLNDQNKKKHISLEVLSQHMDDINLKELNLIIRADSKGSVQALKESLNKLSTSEVAVNIVQATSGAISEGDIRLAEASEAIILGFNVRPTTKAMRDAEKAGVEIRTSSIIYQIVEDIEQALSGMLDPEYKEVYLGRIEIKKVFKVSKIGNIAGCYVEDGKIYADSKIRILRDGIMIYDGELASLKRYQDDAKEVIVGQECGLNIKNFNDIKEGDIVEAYKIDEIQRTLKDVK